jgi:hypothetical protein
MNEIHNGFRLEKQTEQNEGCTGSQRSPSTERGQTHPILGKPVATIPAREYFRLTQKYGQETVHSKEFLKYYNKKFPELTPNKI